MSEKIRDLLNDAVPDLPDAPDRVDAVRRRAEAITRRRRVTGVAAAVVAVAVVAVGAMLVPRLTSNQTPANPDVALACPSSVPATGTGTLVHEEVAAIAVCGYDPSTRAPVGEWRPERATEADVRAIVEITRWRIPPDGTACSRTGLPDYVMLVGHRDGHVTTMPLDGDCTNLGRLVVGAFAELCRRHGIDPPPIRTS